MKRVGLLLLASCGAVSQANPEPAPSPPADTETAPTPPETRNLRCDWLSEGTAIYREDGAIGDDGLKPYVLVRGSTRARASFVEPGERLLLEVTATDVNGDELTDYYGTPGEDPWCSSYDGCVGGVYVGCDDGLLAELWEPGVPSAGVRGTSAVVDGFRWYDLMTSERGGSWTEELEDEDRGVVAGSATLWRMGDDHRYHTIDATEEMFDACRRHMNADEHDSARPFCENAAALAGLRSERGEMTFALGQIAERLGQTADAREMYQRALEDRPNDPAIEARLSGLPEVD